MGPFKNSHGFEHIPCHKASTEESIAMIKSVIFPLFGTLRILISDGGTHFTRKNFKHRSWWNIEPMMQ
jgi:hypothetical protein